MEKMNNDPFFQDLVKIAHTQNAAFNNLLDLVYSLKMEIDSIRTTITNEGE